MNKLHKIWSILLGRNTASTPPEVIVDQMSERRPLPMGRSEFDEWSKRIISGCLVEADEESLKFSLADMLLHLGPTESHKEDAYFIHCLRKFAINQTAIVIRKELYDAKKAREDAEKAEAEKAEVGTKY